MILSFRDEVYSFGGELGKADVKTVFLFSIKGKWSSQEFTHLTHYFAFRVIRVY